MSDRNADKTVIVTGDVAMDWNLARTRRCKRDLSVWRADDITSTYWQRGGSALLADLIEAIAKELQKKELSRVTIRQPAVPRTPDEARTHDEMYHHSYATWSLSAYGGHGPCDDEKKAWRVEEFLGLDRARSNEWVWKKVVNDVPDADLVILDDAGLGFRDRPQLWPFALTEHGKPWILLKMSSPLAEGPLWDYLHRNCSDRLIVVAAVEDLRLSEVQISRELSWERTAQDVFWELVHNPCINSLSHCAHVIISFGTDGAILLSRLDKRGQPCFTCSLFFDPQGIEGTWGQSHPGGMVGYNTCLAASLARQLLLNPEAPDVNAGIHAGLAAMRTLHLQGYGDRGTSASEANLMCPVDVIAATLAQETASFTVTPVQDPAHFVQHRGTPAKEPIVEGYWTILEERYKNALESVAKRVVLEGPEVVLQEVPWGKFGGLFTVDRQEIESFRSIRNLVFEYCRQVPQKRPLSIAVFGPPGAGKSFGIKEIAKSLLPDQIDVCEFNLSQFDSEKDLHDAFHQVRDAGLEGKIPLVFWDEFDTAMGETPLGWLRYFLAPMQDGAFQEGQINHPIGRSIFVFAGGTSTTMAAFNHGPTQEFKAVKGPDFISRLKGYINILGPNPVEMSEINSEADLYFIIRRAILLHSSLKRNARQLFERRDGKEHLNIDKGVLRALLKIPQYKHGVRSIESIVIMSQLADKTSFERSSLPSESQLDLHVDGKRFLSLVQEPELEGDMLERLAKAAHYVYCEGLKKRGYIYGPKKDEERRETPVLVEYDKLPEELKEQNRSNVRDIPVKLAEAGYIMIPARSNDRPFSFPGKTFEKLAEAEHARWMEAMLDDGWSYASETDPEKKLNKCLLSWNKLPEEEKEKDRDLVRGIPDNLAQAGYAIVKS
jgi:RyR domain/ATPase family associated with various cellular activities (AAA)